MRRLAVAVLLLTLFVACSTPRMVRLDTGQGTPLEYRLTTSNKSVQVGAHGFEEALTQLMLTVPLPLRHAQQGQLVRVSYPSNDVDTRWQLLMSKGFGGLCEEGRRREDCLSLLDDVMGLSQEDKLGVALGLSLEPMRESIAQAVENTLAPQFFYTLIATGIISWVVLAANPEPVFTKAAAIISALMLIYLGVDSFLEVVDASRELKRLTDRATTPRELEQAGQHFASRVGPEVSRVIILAVTVVVSQGMNGSAALLSSRLSMLPSLSEATALGASQAGIHLASVGHVSAVSVVESTVIISLPVTAVAMVAHNPRGAESKPLAAEWYDHHIATDKWLDATHSGGPWTPKFQELFERAGMSLNDAANIVRVRGHRGPHPQEYHEEVYRRLREAMQGCRSISQCKEALKVALKELADEIAMEGSMLNKLVTRVE